MIGITKEYIFNDPNDFLFDDTKSSITDKLRLKLIDKSGLLFNQKFVDDTGFTYDSDKVEFLAGKVQQKDKRPGTNSTFGVNYNTGINGNWGEGVLTGTPVGGAAVLGDKLDLTYDDIRYVEYNPDGSKVGIQIGAIKFKVTPNYSGNPSTSKTFFSIAAFPSSNNYITVMHHSGGLMYLYIFDKNNIQIIGTSLGTWVPVISTEYEFELNYDITSGATRLFIDGVQFGATQAGTGIRDSNIIGIRVGTENGASKTSNFKIDDFVIFSSVQHVASYTPGYCVGDYEWCESKVECPQFSYSGLGDIQALINFVSTETGIPRYVLDDKYWDGSIWTASNGTYAQANSKADILAHIATYSPASNIVDIDIIFPNSNAVQSDVDDLTVTYTGQEYSIDTQKIAVKDIFKQDELFECNTVQNEPVNTKVRGFYRVNGQAFWFNVALLQIEVSDESIDQANTLQEFKDYLCQKYDPQNTQLVVLIKSDDGVTTPEVEKITFRYSYSMPDLDKGLCNIESEIGDMDMERVKDIEMNVELICPSKVYKEMQITELNHVFKSVDRIFNFKLLQTEDMGAGAYYKFTWQTSKQGGDTVIWKKIIPNTLFGSMLKDLPDFTG